mmetsp:Transcript_51959/g.111135  ORF Transcript_51959/g.111135 Transcript_51959/m.111135 type:complete len:351 (+) Transcript_51959:80-1132(+)
MATFTLIGNLTFERFHVSVKNTFISDVTDEDDWEEARPRRASSLPPSLRLAGAGDVANCCSASSHAVQAKQALVEDGNSTETGASSEEETWSENGAEDMASSASISLEEHEAEEALEEVQLGVQCITSRTGYQRWLPPAPTEAPPAPPSEEPPASNHACKDVNACESKVFLGAPVCSCGGGGAVAVVRPLRLNSNARAWEPSEAVVAAPLAPTLRQEVGAILVAAQAALLSCLWIMTAEVVPGTAGIQSIVATIRAQDFHLREAVLTCAKQAILDACASSQRVYTLGYKARPFMTTPGGFAVKLGVVLNERAACWGLLKQGFCCFEGQCRWVHPACQTRVDVKVKIAESC